MQNVAVSPPEIQSPAFINQLKDLNAGLTRKLLHQQALAFFKTHKNKLVKVGKRNAEQLEYCLILTDFSIASMQTFLNWLSEYELTDFAQTFPIQFYFYSSDLADEIEADEWLNLRTNE